MSTGFSRAPTRREDCGPAWSVPGGNFDNLTRPRMGDRRRGPATTSEHTARVESIGPMICDIYIRTSVARLRRCVQSEGLGVNRSERPPLHVAVSLCDKPAFAVSRKISTIHSG